MIALDDYLAEAMLDAEFARIWNRGAPRRERNRRRIMRTRRLGYHHPARWIMRRLWRGSD